MPLDKHVVSVSNDGISFEMEFAPQNDTLEQVSKKVSLTPQGSIDLASKSVSSSKINSDLFRPVMISSK